MAQPHCCATQMDLFFFFFSCCWRCFSLLSVLLTAHAHNILLATPVISPIAPPVGWCGALRWGSCVWFWSLCVDRDIFVVQTEILFWTEDENISFENTPICVFQAFVLRWLSCFHCQSPRRLLTLTSLSTLPHPSISLRAVTGPRSSRLLSSAFSLIHWVSLTLIFTWSFQ